MKKLKPALSWIWTRDLQIGQAGFLTAGVQSHPSFSVEDAPQLISRASSLHKCSPNMDSKGSMGQLSAMIALGSDLVLQASRCNEVGLH